MHCILLSVPTTNGEMLLGEQQGPRHRKGKAVPGSHRSVRSMPAIATCWQCRRPHQPHECRVCLSGEVELSHLCPHCKGELVALLRPITDPLGIP